MSGELSRLGTGEEDRARGNLGALLADVAKSISDDDSTKHDVRLAKDFVRDINIMCFQEVQTNRNLFCFREDYNINHRNSKSPPLRVAPDDILAIKDKNKNQSFVKPVGSGSKVDASVLDT